jgi:hypothetical protein
MKYNKKIQRNLKSPIEKRASKHRSKNRQEIVEPSLSSVAYLNDKLKQVNTRVTDAQDIFG